MKEEALTKMVFSVDGALQYQNRSGKDPKGIARAIGQAMEALKGAVPTAVQYWRAGKSVDVAKLPPSERPKPTTRATPPIIAAPYKPPIQKK
jgi:hypothetical protein